MQEELKKFEEVLEAWRQAETQSVKLQHAAQQAFSRCLLDATESNEAGRKARATVDSAEEMLAADLAEIEAKAALHRLTFLKEMLCRKEEG